MKQDGPMKELKVTSATEWRKMREEGVLVPLPSGRVARLRPVGIEELVRRGSIPDALTGLAAETIWKAEPSREHVVALGKSAVEFLNIIVQAAFLEPRVTMDTPGEDEISIDDVDLDDKQYVFMWVTGPTRALKMFRLQQAANVATVPDGPQNGAKTEHSAPRS